MSRGRFVVVIGTQWGDEGKGKASVLGAPFIKEDYGIAFPRKGPDVLRNKVDTTLLKMREDGSYQRIHDKWFGKK